jgi:hypothetical protein
MSFTCGAAVDRLEDMAYQCGMILLPRGQHVTPDNWNCSNVGKGLWPGTGTEVMVLWLVSSIITMKMQGLTKSANHEATDHYGIQCPRCSCVSSHSTGSDCGCTVLQVISAVTPTSCTLKPASRTGLKCHHSIWQCYSPLGRHCYHHPVALGMENCRTSSLYASPLSVWLQYDS